MMLLTSVAHSSSWWSGNTSDEADSWLVLDVVLLQELGSILLGGTTNLTNHDDTISLLVLQENLQAVDEVSAREWVTTDTDDKRLTETSLGGLVDGLVSKSSGSRNDTDAAALVNETWHDTNLALAWGDKTWAVRTDQASLSLGLEDVGNANHVVLWDTLSNARFD
jgi:hypothetical protein